jgi:AraC-like DNA-binding protein
MSGWVAMRTLYFPPELIAKLPRRCCVIAVQPLLRELILHAIALGALRARDAAHRRFVDFLLDQLRELPAVALELPMPRDARAQRVAHRLRENPAETASLAELARAAGVSRRTLERLFPEETGLSLGRWRQQVRLLHAMRLLARGEPVTTTALEVGYESPSAFIAAFSAVLGTTPGRYYRQPGEREKRSPDSVVTSPAPARDTSSRPSDTAASARRASRARGGSAARAS